MLAFRQPGHRSVDTGTTPKASPIGQLVVSGLISVGALALLFVRSHDGRRCCCTVRFFGRLSLLGLDVAKDPATGSAEQQQSRDDGAAREPDTDEPPKHPQVPSLTWGALVVAAVDSERGNQSNRARPRNLDVHSS